MENWHYNSIRKSMPTIYKNDKGEFKMAHKYNVSEDNRTVECLSSFAGKPVRGIAKCDPDDNFNVESGKEIAFARCELKISNKRRKKAFANYARAQADFERAKERLTKASDYIVDATIEYGENKKKLEAIESKYK
jgi:hypothetical protein